MTVDAKRELVEILNLPMQGKVESALGVILPVALGFAVTPDLVHGVAMRVFTAVDKFEQLVKEYIELKAKYERTKMLTEHLSNSDVAQASCLLSAGVIVNRYNFWRLALPNQKMAEMLFGYKIYPTETNIIFMLEQGMTDLLKVCPVPWSEEVVWAALRNNATEAFDSIPNATVQQFAFARRHLGEAVCRKLGTIQDDSNPCFADISAVSSASASADTIKALLGNSTIDNFSRYVQKVIGGAVIKDRDFYLLKNSPIEDSYRRFMLWITEPDSKAIAKEYQERLPGLLELTVRAGITPSLESLAEFFEKPKEKFFLKALDKGLLLQELLPLALQTSTFTILEKFVDGGVSFDEESLKLAEESCLWGDYEKLLQITENEVLLADYE